jgi:chromate transporter
MAVAAFAALAFAGLPFPLVILLAGLAGALFLAPAHAKPPPRGVPVRGALGVVVAFSALWAAPLLALWATGQTFLLQVGLFFSKLALVTFGGAYAVLAYMRQEVVAERGWLSLPQMIDALGLAETTPGPLILVTQFVAFLAGHAEGGPGLAVAAALLTLWVTFVPSFLWIFAFAPHVEAITSRPRLQGALSGISAAVVGVIGSLALWFALHVLFAQVGDVRLGFLQLPLPAAASLRPLAVILTGLAALLLLVRHWPLGAVLAVSALCGLVTLALPGLA